MSGLEGIALVLGLGIAGLAVFLEASARKLKKLDQAHDRQRFAPPAE